MRLLVTGANGFVGRAVCAAAESAGWEVVRAVRSGVPAGKSAAVVGDIHGGTDWSAALAGVKGIIHLAARVHVLRETDADPLKAFRLVNVAGTEALARQAISAGVRRMVFVSSIKVNGEGTAPGAPYREADPPAPADAYGRTKLEAELALRALASGTTLEVVVVRPPLVIGAGVRGNLERLLRVIDRGVPLPFGSLGNRRSLITDANLAALLLAVVTLPAAAGELFLAADSPSLSTPELVRLLARGLGRSARLLPVPVGLLRRGCQLTGREAVLERVAGSLEINAERASHIVGMTAVEPLEQGVLRAAAAFAAGRRSA